MATGEVQVKRVMVQHSVGVSGCYSGYYTYYRRNGSGPWEGGDRGQAYAVRMAAQVYGVRIKDVVLTWK